MNTHPKADLPDNDNPEWSDQDMQRASRVNDLPATLQRTVRGRPKATVTKTRVTIRLDADVVQALKASGPGWQTRLNQWVRERTLG